MATRTVFRASCMMFLFFILSLTEADLPGSWQILVENAGISSMHTAVTRFNTVVLLDRTGNGPTRKLLRKGHCRFDSSEKVPKKDCYAHSVLFDLDSLNLRPLTIQTDTWCSSGQFLPDGTLLQTGGDLDGNRKIRKFVPCESNALCDWVELKDTELVDGRWYSTNQILPDGSIIIVGGRGTSTVEFFPPKYKSVKFPFLLETEDKQMDNLYPYVHLLPDGNLFIFANTKAVLYDYKNDIIVRVYPPLEGGPRNYPSAGSSVMLALEPRNGEYTTAEIVVCGGAKFGAFLLRNVDEPAYGSCGRIVATETEASWEIEEMPFGRIMGDMVMLPTGDVLVINGAQAGTQGFNLASNPCLYPLLYRPCEPAGLRFMTLSPSTIPRMYHSTANLLPDGRVLLAGSNTHYFYEFEGTNFPTELRLEAFSPEYLAPDRANLRPIVEEAPATIRYGDNFEVIISVNLPVVGIVEVNLASAPFATHSFSQGQRLVKLTVSSAIPVAEGIHRYRISCSAPPNSMVAPPSYYMAFAVNQGVPSVARWIQLL